MLGKNNISLLNVLDYFFVQRRIIPAAADGTGEIDFLFMLPLHKKGPSDIAQAFKVQILRY